ncbi:MAG TPA: hypothetical protein VF158_07655 [Longimicrobiales bacterium]
MRRRPLWMVLVGAAAVAGGCSDEGSPLEPTLEPDVVAGVYDITRMTFDPDGSIPEVDIAQRLDPTVRPQLVVALDLTFQLAYIDPATKKIITVDGEYETLVDGIRLKFPSRDASQQILLPPELDLVYAAEAATLAFQGGVDADLARLVALAPEYAEEQFPDPVRGELDIEFTRRAAG